MEEKNTQELNEEQLSQLKYIFLNPARNEGEEFKDYQERRKLVNRYYKNKQKGKLITFEEHIKNK